MRAPGWRPPRLYRRIGSVLGRDVSARAGLTIVLLLLLAALAADLLSPVDPLRLGTAAEQLAPPGAGHPLGTDALGRDMLARLLHGARLSLLVGWVAVALAVGIGAVIGLAAMQCSCK